MVIASVVSQRDRQAPVASPSPPPAFPKNVIPCKKLITGELTSGKARRSAASAALEAARGPDYDFSKCD